MGMICEEEKLGLYLFRFIEVPDLDYDTHSGGIY